MAMRGRNVHYRLRDIHRRHFNATARRCGLGTDMENILEDITSRAATVVADVGARLPAAFPEPLFAVITQGLLRSAQALQQEQAATGLV
jgi:serine/threonine-protein kinase HipA